MANGSERIRTEAMSIDSEGERLSDAHHDWEERDDASDVGVEHTEEEIPSWSHWRSHRIRNSAAGMTSRDAVGIKTVFERRASVMRSVSHVRRGAFRAAYRVALNETVRGCEVR